MRINNDEPVFFFTSSSNYTTPESTPSPIDDSILRPFPANIENNNYDLFFRNLSINEHNQQQLQQQDQNQNQNQQSQQQLHQNQYQQEQLKSAKVDNYSATASSSSSSATPAPAPVTRKMSKRACDSCNVRKIFCDGKQPCESCNRAKINCTFLKTHLRPGPRKPRVKTFQLINSSQVDWKQGQGRGRKRRRSGSSDDDAASNPTSGTGEGSATGVSGAKSSIPAAVSEAKRCSIPLKVLTHYIDIYSERLYPVWPVVSAEELKSRLANEKDLDAYALATALCAAVLGQLRLDSAFDMEDSISKPITGGVLAAECLRLRMLFPYREKFNLEAILTSFFLHIHYINRNKSRSASLCLREAIAFAQIMKLDRESTYASIPPHEGESRRKLFWLLFITDVSHAIQHGFPTSLEMTINFPTVEDSDEPILAGFMNIVLLFTRLYKYKSVIDSWIYQEKTSCSQESLKLLQFELSESYPFKVPSNDIQKADVLATRHWMRLVAWNVSMKHGFLSSDPSEVAMGLAFPATIAEDLVEVLSTLPRSAIEAHGNSMELKLFEITNSLGDLIIHAPLLVDTPVLKVPPREYFHQLLEHMVQFRDINESILSIVMEKGERIGVPIPSRKPSACESDDSKTEFRFVHELTEEGTKSVRKSRGSKSSASGVRTHRFRAASADSSDYTDTSLSGDRLIFTGRTAQIFDEDYSIVTATTTAASSPLRKTSMSNEYFSPFM